MTTLTIDQLTATSTRELAARTKGVLAGLADGKLDDALRRVALPDGHWFVRRLEVPLTTDFSRPDPSLQESWAVAVVEALHAALASGSSDVLFYRRRRDLLVDLVCGLATGDLRREWAWVRAGAVTPDFPSPSSDPRGAALAALELEPEAVAAVLVDVIDRVGVDQVHRLLGASGWRELTDIAMEGLSGILSAASLAAVLRRPPSSEPAEHTARRGEAVLRASRLGSAFEASSLAVDEDVASSWAVLVLLESDPALLTGSDAAAAVRVIAQRLSGATASARQRSGGDPAATLTDAGLGSPGTAAQLTPEGVAASSSRNPDEDMTSAPWATGWDEQPVFATVWGGLLFLLGSAEDADVPGGLLVDAALAERPLPWCLRQLAVRLVPAADDDPAVRAFAGADPDVEPPLSQPPGDAESASLELHAHRWAAATARRLEADADLDPFEVVRGIALRRAEVAWAPGWIEVHFRVDDVDIGVRRAGLDVDPGWLAWLGAVVRFVYA